MATCGDSSCTCHDGLLIMTILLSNMMQSTSTCSFSVSELITGSIGEALANDGEGTVLFIGGCTDSDRVIAEPHCGRSRIPNSFRTNINNIQFWALLVLSKNHLVHLFAK